MPPPKSNRYRPQPINGIPPSFEEWNFHREARRIANRDRARRRALPGLTEGPAAAAAASAGLAAAIAYSDKKRARRAFSRRNFLGGLGAGAGALLLPGSAEAGKQRIQNAILSKRGGGPGYWAENRPPMGTAHSLPVQLFPADNWWNLNIAGAPLDANNAAYVAGVAGVSLNQIFDENDGYSWCTVSNDYPKISFDHCSTASESNMVPIPIPIPAITERGWTENVGISPALNETLADNDRHLLIVELGSNKLYEMYQPYYNSTGSTVVVGGSFNVLPGQWYTYSVSVWDMDTNDQRPLDWTSSTAAGTAALPSLVNFDEVVGSAEITHAHGICFNFGHDGSLDPEYVWPARHAAASDSPTHIPFGGRFRLKSNFALGSYRSEVQRLGRAFKSHGWINVDNSTNGDVSGMNDDRWGDYYLGAGGLTWAIQLFMWQINMGTHCELVELGWGAP